MRVAAIDIGTNSVLLLVAERRGDDVVPIVERATITRLGQGVDRTRTLAPEAVQRTLACLERYAEELRSAGASRVDAVGTSAMRDERFGSYSMCSTIAGTLNLLRLKSMIRYMRL